MNQRKTALVLCTGNSCRSQMAAAFLHRLGGDRLEVDSAGTEPAATVHPLTAQVMAEVGIDLGDPRPADYRRFVGTALDYLIVVCDGAAATCPSGWPGVRSRLEWPFDDPAGFSGTPDQTLAEFRRVRDEIGRKVRDWLEEPDG